MLAVEERPPIDAAMRLPQFGKHLVSIARSRGLAFGGHSGHDRISAQVENIGSVATDRMTGSRVLRKRGRAAATAACDCRRHGCQRSVRRLDLDALGRRATASETACDCDTCHLADGNSDCHCNHIASVGPLTSWQAPDVDATSTCPEVNNGRGSFGSERGETEGSVDTGSGSGPSGSAQNDCATQCIINAYAGMIVCFTGTRRNRTALVACIAAVMADLAQCLLACAMTWALGRGRISTKCGDQRVLARQHCANFQCPSGQSCKSPLHRGRWRDPSCPPELPCRSVTTDRDRCECSPGQRNWVQEFCGPCA